MKSIQNVGTADRIIRLAVGALLVAALVAGTFTAPLSYGAIVIAGILLVTGATGFCPLYAIFRIRTNGSQRA